MPYFDSFFEQEPTASGKWLQVQKARQVLQRLRAQDVAIQSMLEMGPDGASWPNLVLPRGSTTRESKSTKSAPDISVHVDTLLCSNVFRQYHLPASDSMPQSPSTSSNICLTYFRRNDC